MKTLGYIVQHFDEDSLTPNGPGKRLFVQFNEAHDHAKELVNLWYQNNSPTADGPVDYYQITKTIVDNQQSALLFRSAVVFIWIEVVYTQ